MTSTVMRLSFSKHCSEVSYSLRNLSVLILLALHIVRDMKRIIMESTSSLVTE
jgi:hypothetical protein